MRRIHPELSRILTAIAMLTAVTTSTAAQQARGSGGLPPRDEWQRVPEILAALGVTEGQRVADVAAGQGYLTKPLARHVGKSGRVYAVEIGEEPITPSSASAAGHLDPHILTIKRSASYRRP